MNRPATLNSANARLSPLLLSTAAVLLLLGLWLWSQQLNASWFSLWNGAGQHLPAAVWANLTLVADTLFAVAAILMVASYHPRLLGQSLLLLLLGGLFVHLIKQGLNVPRPPAVLDADSFRLIGPALKNESFPSGHAFTAMSAATLIALNLKHVTLSALVIIIGGLAAVSRAMVGAHWPLDILVGSGSGILFAWLCVRLEYRYHWLQRNGWRFFSLILLTLASLALAFHDDRYPDTQALSILASLAALWLAIRRYWLPLLRALRAN